VVEGVGGLMSPIAEHATGLDLMAALDLPSILVGGSYLGAVSHLLTAAACLRARGLALQAVVLSQSGEEGAPDLAETAAMVAELEPDAAVLAIPRHAGTPWAAQLLSHVLVA
jgi:dethiobiotin synthetase